MALLLITTHLNIHALPEDHAALSTGTNETTCGQEEGYQLMMIEDYLNEIDQKDLVNKTSYYLGLLAAVTQQNKDDQSDASFRVTSEQVAQYDVVVRIFSRFISSLEKDIDLLMRKDGGRLMPAYSTSQRQLAALTELGVRFMALDMSTVEGIAQCRKVISEIKKEIKAGAEWHKDLPITLHEGYAAALVSSNAMNPNQQGISQEQLQEYSKTNRALIISFGSFLGTFVICAIGSLFWHKKYKQRCGVKKTNSDSVLDETEGVSDQQTKV